MSRAVIDQPGLRVFLAGIVLSFVLGYGLRSQISPEKLNPHIAKAVNRLSQDFRIDFKEVHVELSNWGLPLPYIEIADVRITPRAIVCQDSQIFIKQIQLPIRLISIFTGTGIVEKIRLSDAEIRLGKLDHCIDQGGSKSTNQKVDQKDAALDSISAAATPAAAVATANNNSASFFQRRSAASLKQIHIDQLRLILTQYPSQPIVIKNMNFDISYDGQKLKDIALTSQVYAIKDATSDVLFFKGDANALLKMNQIGELDGILNIKGQVLDGSINLFSTYSSLSKSIQSEIRIQKLSTKVLSNLPLFSDTKAVQMLSTLPLSVNLEAFGSQRTGQENFEYKIRNLSLFSGNSKISTPELSVIHKNKVTFIDNFVAQVDDFDLEQFRQFSEFNEVSKSIDQFGSFSGKLQYKTGKNENRDQLHLDGDLKKISFIFSNNGQRDLQVIDSATLSLDRTQNETHFEVSQIKTNGRDIQGQITATLNQSKNESYAKAELKGGLLGDAVWKQLTDVPQTPEISLKWNYRHDFEEKHDLSLSINAVQSAGVDLKDLKFELVQTFKDQKSDSLSMTGIAKSATVIPNNLTNDFFKTIFSAGNHLNGAQYVSENLQLSLNGPQWKNLNFALEASLKEASSKVKTHRIHIDGKTTLDESVDGDLIVYDYLNNEKMRNHFAKSITGPIQLTKQND